MNRRPPWYLWLPTLLIAGLMSIPVLHLLFEAFSHTADVEKLWSPVALSRMGRTLALAAGVTSCVVVLSLVLAWLTVRTDMRLKQWLSVLIVLPLAVPPYVTAYALLSLGGNNGLLVQVLGIDSALLQSLFTNPQTGLFHLPRLHGYAGALIALTAYNLPYVYLPVRAAWQDMDSSLEEASRSLGRGRIATLFLVTGPQLLPALLAGGLLAALHVVADFGVVSLMRYDTLSASLYARYNAFDLGNASRLGMLLVLLASVLVSLEWLVLRRLRLVRTGVGSARKAAPIALKSFQLPAMSLCLLVFFIGAVLPVGIACFWMSHLPEGAEPWRKVGHAIVGSVSGSLPAAVIAVILAIPVAVLGVRYPGRWSGLLQRMPLVGYAVPALAFGLSLIMLCTARWMPDAIYSFFYQSMPLLVMAYVFHFLAEALGPVRSSLMLTSPKHEEAARSLGSSWLGAMVRVTLPVMRHGLVVAAALVFLSCMKELPLTMILAPIGVETLARSAWDHTENAEFALAAPYALAILCCSAGFVTLLLVERRHAR